MRKIYSPVDRAARERRERDAKVLTDELRRLHEGVWLDNGSTTDTLQWCQLHRGHCHDVVVVRRSFDNPKRRDEIFFACQKCIRDLKKAELIQDSKYAGYECYEVVVPKGLSRGRVELDESALGSRQQSFEVTLGALQVKYLRALGLQVIPA